MKIRVKKLPPILRILRAPSPLEPVKSREQSPSSLGYAEAKTALRSNPSNPLNPYPPSNNLLKHNQNKTNKLTATQKNEKRFCIVSIKPFAYLCFVK